MGDIKDPTNAVLKAKSHSDQGIDAAHDKTTNDYIQEGYKHNDAFLTSKIELAGRPERYNLHHVSITYWSRSPKTACFEERLNTLQM